MASIGSGNQQLKNDCWENNLLVGFLKHQQIVRLVLDGHDVVKEEVILRESGRVREVSTGPDGALYVLIDKRGMRNSRERAQRAQKI